MLPSLGAVAPPTPSSFDEEAFAELYKFGDTLASTFNQNAVDRALERLIQQPSRKQSGHRLAARLVRDAAKHLKVNRRHEFLTDELEADNLASDPPTALDLYEIQLAVRIIQAGLEQLSVRDRQVFLYRMTERPSNGLGVGERQFRNLLTGARNRLFHQDRMAEACQVVMYGLSHWRWETIELLGPLAVCLAAAN